MQSIIFKFTQLQQYNSKSQTIIWEDSTPVRWDKIYGKLNVDERGYFIGKGKVYCAILAKINSGQTALEFKDVEEFNLAADEFLSLNAAHPELNARVKALFQPFISSKSIEYDEFKKEANSRNFVRFFIVKKNTFDPTKFIINDRIVFITDDFIFESFGILNNTGGISNDLPDGFFNAKGKTIYDIKQIFEEINEKNKKEHSNNIKQVDRIIERLKNADSYEFSSFSSYFNMIHNKKAYLFSSINSIQFFVGGAFWDGSDPRDQTERFVREGVWENGYVDKFEDLVNSVPVGSRFAIKTTYKKDDEMEIKALGEVTKNHRDGHLLSVEWDEDFEPFKLDFSGGYWDTIKRVTIPDHTKQIFFHEKKDDSLKINNSSIVNLNHNIILYGPPGTGKTYSTIEKAIKIADEEFAWPQDELESNKREKVKTHFNSLIKEGKIRFITFHQSMSYEDFVEGIKPRLEKDSDDPEKDNSHKLTYHIQPGLFKQISTDASFAFVSREDDDIRTILDFSDLYDVLIEDISERLANDEEVFLKTKSEGKVQVTHISENDNLWIRHLDTEGRKYTVSKNRLEVLYSNIPDLNSINNIHQVFKDLIGGMNSTAYWSVLNRLEEIKNDSSIIKPKKDLQKYTHEEKLKAIDKIDWKKVVENEVDKYVLIVDEINRGNISSIFGELITLLEDDKRAGMPEELSVILPYSKTTFSVPSNLYIIGTMNTADRSIEALDTALRRRFSFEFMPPKIEKVSDYVINGIALKKIFAQINERITFLIDPDHQIGHSYFMGIKNEHQLKYVFKNKIIPLLEEYFYNDFRKIYLVLGEGFVEKLKDNEKPKFAVNDNDEFEREIYRIRSIGETFDIKAALNKLYAE